VALKVLAGFVVFSNRSLERFEVRVDVEVLLDFRPLIVGDLLDQRQFIHGLARYRCRPRRIRTREMVTGPMPRSRATNPNAKTLRGASIPAATSQAQLCSCNKDRHQTHAMDRPQVVAGGGGKSFRLTKPERSRGMRPPSLAEVFYLVQRGCEFTEVEDFLTSSEFSAQPPVFLPRDHRKPAFHHWLVSFSAARVGIIRYEIK